MFIGQYQHSLDSKKRLFIPSNIRAGKQNKFIVTCGLEKCLFMYIPQDWKIITDKLKTLSFTKTDARQFKRLFFSGASEAKLDRQGRILLPDNLYEYAGLKKHVIIIGVQDRVEIWDRGIWKKYQNKASEKYSAVAENLVF